MRTESRRAQLPAHGGGAGRAAAREGCLGATLSVSAADPGPSGAPAQAGGPLRHPCALRQVQQVLYATTHFATKARLQISQTYHQIGFGSSAYRTLDVNVSTYLAFLPKP